jgi:hypothetical protein
MKSFEHKIYEYDTELSKYVWKLKNILGKTTESMVNFEASSIVFGRW